jgi:hypothetical protein
MFSIAVPKDEITILPKRGLVHPPNELMWDVESILEVHIMRKILEAGERDSLWRDGG